MRVIVNEECEITEGAPAWPLNQFVSMLVEKFRKLVTLIFPFYILSMIWLR